MSNRFFDFVNQLISGSVAKSSEVNAQFQAIATGFDDTELELNRSIKFPSAESATNQVISQLPAARQGYMIGFDASGNLRVGASFLIDWSMANHRLRDLPTPVAADEAVTLGYLQAYSASLVAGLPAIAGQNGPLTTDGATVIWDSTTRLIPSTASVTPGAVVYYDGTTVGWIIPRQNRVFDANGAQGSTYWSTSLNNVEATEGYYFTNSAPLVAATFDHKPNSSAWIPFSAAATITLAVTVNAGGTTAGTIGILIRYYDVALNLISSSASTAVSMGVSGGIRYTVSDTTPSGTAWVVPVLVFTGVSAVAGGVKVRNIKLENGTATTPWNDDKTTYLLGAAKQINTFGYGFASPQMIVGDATATTSTYDMRSEAGAQAYDVRIRSTGGTNGTAGKGVLAVEAKTMTNTGPIGYSAEYNAGNSGAAITIDFLNGSRQRLTMNNATPAITVSTAGLVVGHYQLKLIQDGTGGRAPTYVGFAAGDCVGNALPVLGAGANAVTFLYLYWDGSQFWVSSSAWDA